MVTLSVPKITKWPPVANWVTDHKVLVKPATYNVSSRGIMNLLPDRLSCTDTHKVLAAVAFTIEPSGSITFEAACLIPVSIVISPVM
jgi:hypothetical protein